MRATEIEEARIQQAYASRQAKDSRYSYFNKQNLWIMQEREAAFLKALSKKGISDLSQHNILDIGCGSGRTLADFLRWGASADKLTGLDLLSHRIEEAQTLLPSSTQLFCRGAQHTGLESESQDIVLQSTCFSSILDKNLCKEIASEMLRVLKPNGLILWYDFHMNNPTNKSVRGIKEAEIRSLFKGSKLSLQRITLAPPLARKLPFHFLYSFFNTLPFLRTHYLGVIQKR